MRENRRVLFFWALLCFLAGFSLSAFFSPKWDFSQVAVPFLLFGVGVGLGAFIANQSELKLSLPKKTLLDMKLVELNLRLYAHQPKRLINSVSLRNWADQLTVILRQMDEAPSRSQLPKSTHHEETEEHKIPQKMSS